MPRKKGDYQKHIAESSSCTDRTEQLLGKESDVCPDLTTSWLSRLKRVTELDWDVLRTILVSALEYLCLARTAVCFVWLGPEK